MSVKRSDKYQCGWNWGGGHGCLKRYPHNIHLCSCGLAVNQAGRDKQGLVWRLWK